MSEIKDDFVKDKKEMGLSGKITLLILKIILYSAIPVIAFFFITLACITLFRLNQIFITCAFIFFFAYLISIPTLIIISLWTAPGEFIKTPLDKKKRREIAFDFISIIVIMIVVAIVLILLSMGAISWIS